MMTEIGHYALVLALFVAIIQGTVPFYGASRGDIGLMKLGKISAIVQFLLILFALIVLLRAYVISDFSLLNVAQNSYSDKPLLYKLTGVWSNHEGSMLLWIAILTLFGAASAVFGRNMPPSFLARVMGMQGLISIGFLAFILVTSNPFTRLLEPPLNGRGMNALLQDGGIALHPPFLYLGYVGFSVAFSFAGAALLEGRVDPAWARWIRPWVLAAWAFLTAGIAFGSWWAYYELGWGGWWFWDPVENSSFMPWLAGTALLHSAIVVEKRDTLKSWTVLLAIITFSLSLLGTFLVRSGVLTSVHAFATDPRRGVFILVLLLLAVGGSFALYAWRAPTLKGGGLFRPISREGSLVFNNLLMSTAAALVLVGTTYPLMLEAVTGEKISVGSPFYNATFIPVMTPMVLTMAFGPLLPWKRGDLLAVADRMKFVAFATVVVAALLLWLADGPVFLVFGFGLAAWLGFGTIYEWAMRIKLFSVPLMSSLKRARNLPRSSYGMTIAHLGTAIIIGGITGASAWSVESVQSMAFGDKVDVAGNIFTLNSVRQVPGPNYTSLVAEVTVQRRDDPDNPLLLKPEKRIYVASGQPTTEAAIDSRVMGDVYAVIGEPDENAPADAPRWVTRFYWKPMVPWLWHGSTLLIIGGFLSLSDRRYRIGAPTRSLKQKKASVAQPAE